MQPKNNYHALTSLSIAFMWHELIVMVLTECDEWNSNYDRQQLSKKEYGDIKGAMWAFRQPPEQLKDSEWELLQRLFTYSPKMKEAYILREELTEIFERKYDPKGASRRDSCLV
jgi:hypothetical protein